MNIMALPRIESLPGLIAGLVATSFFYLLIIILVFKKTPKKERKMVFLEAWPWLILGPYLGLFIFLYILPHFFEDSYKSEGTKCFEGFVHYYGYIKTNEFLKSLENKLLLFILAFVFLYIVLKMLPKVIERAKKMKPIRMYSGENDEYVTSDKLLAKKMKLRKKRIVYMRGYFKRVMFIMKLLDEIVTGCEYHGKLYDALLFAHVPDYESFSVITGWDETGEKASRYWKRLEERELAYPKLFLRGSLSIVVSNIGIFLLAFAVALIVLTLKSIILLVRNPGEPIAKYWMVLTRFHSPLPYLSLFSLISLILLLMIYGWWVKRVLRSSNYARRVSRKIIELLIEFISKQISVPFRLVMADHYEGTKVMGKIVHRGSELYILEIPPKSNT